MRIFLADANPEVRYALLLHLGQEPGVEVTGLAVESKGLLAQVQATQPDIVLLDWDLPGEPAAKLVTALRSLEPMPGVIVLGVRPDILRAVQTSGADAYITKDAPPDALVPLMCEITAQQKTQAKKRVLGPPDCRPID